MTMWCIADLVHQRGDDEEAAVLAHSVLDWMSLTGRDDDDEAKSAPQKLAQATCWLPATD